MKKRVLLGATLLSMLVLGASCNKEEVKPDAAVLYPSPVVKIGLDIHVKASSVAGAKIGGLSGATVIVKQNGKSFTATTDESGIATFADLTEGDVSYFISGSGFAKINGSTSLYYDGSPDVNGTNGNSTNGSNVTVNNTQTSSVSLNVTLPRIGSNVSGVVMGDLDGNGPAQTTPITTGTIVLKFTNSGLEPNTYKATIGSGGVYSFTNLPENQSYELYTEGITSTIPATVNTPSYSLNLEIDQSGQTPAIGRTTYNGISYLD